MAETTPETPAVPATIDPVDLPLLDEALPLAAEGLAYIGRLLGMTARERRDHFAALSAAEIAHHFLAMGDVAHIAQGLVHDALHREAIDRFVSQGSNAVEKALRGHARETRLQQDVSAQLAQYSVLRGGTAAWIKQRAEFEAGIEHRERELQQQDEALQRTRAEARQIAAEYHARQPKRVSHRVGARPAEG